MHNKKNYHQPILEKKYNRILSALETLDEHTSKSSTIFSRALSKIKKVLFYELPVEIIIEEKAKNKNESPNENKATVKEKRSKVA